MPTDDDRRGAIGAGDAPKRSTLVARIVCACLLPIGPLFLIEPIKAYVGSNVLLGLLLILHFGLVPYAAYRLVLYLQRRAEDRDVR